MGAQVLVPARRIVPPVRRQQRRRPFRELTNVQVQRMEKLQQQIPDLKIIGGNNWLNNLSLISLPSGEMERGLPP